MQSGKIVLQGQCPLADHWAKRRAAAAQILSASQRGVPGSNDVDVQVVGNALAPDDGGSHSLWPWPSDYLVTFVPGVPNR